MSMTGQCLCGAVRYTASDIHRVDACHCGMCRRWGAGPAFGAEPERVDWQGGEAITAYRSSDWAERGFCARCGTHLFYRLVEGGFLSINPFTLDAPGDLTFEVEVFVDEKPAFYDFANDTRKMTGAEVVALFTGGGS